MHSLINGVRTLGLVGLALASVYVSAAGPQKGKNTLSPAAEKAVHKQLTQGHEAFIQNNGQWDSQAKFRAQTPGMDAWLTDKGLTFDYHRVADRKGKKIRMGQVVAMDLIGSHGAVSRVGVGARKYSPEFMSRGTGLMHKTASFNEVMSHDVYPGVDMRTYYQGSQIRYDFMLAPNASASAIQLGFRGASSVSVKNDDLKLGTQLGEFAHGKLYAYQYVNGKRVHVPAAFAMTGNQVGFKLGAYDHTKSLVIDPVVYGSYYGGDNGWDVVTSVTADSNGNVFMTGSTGATLFPVTTGPYFTSLKGTQNAFVARLQGDAYNIDYSAFFGGSNADQGQFVTVDQFGNVWIAGTTTSPDFPHNTKTNTSPTQPNIFLIRFQISSSLILDPITNPTILMLGSDTGAASTATISGFQILADPNPQAGDPVTLVMDGVTNQAIPEMPGGTFASGKGYLLRFTYDGTSFSTSAASQYIGDGLSVDMGGLALDNQGNMYIAGDVGDGNNNYDTSIVGSTTFVTTGGVFTGGRILQKNDLFIRKYSPTGSLIYSCLIGGAGNELVGGFSIDETGANFPTGNCLAIDSLGNAYITGMCFSFDYPRTRGAYGEVFDAFQNVVVTKIAPDASQIIYSTNLKVKGLGEPATGGVPAQNLVVPAGIALDQSGTAFITGNMPVVALTFPQPPANPQDPSAFSPGSIQTIADGSDLPVSSVYTFPAPPKLPTSETWMNVLDPTGTKLLYGTYLGGNLDDAVYGPYVDSFGDCWVFGYTDSGRGYIDPVSISPVTDSGSLPAGLITPKAFKANGDAGLGPQQLNGVLWGGLAGPGPGPATINALYNRDGWLAKFSIGRPIVNAINITPGTIPGGLGATASMNLTLSSAAPVQGATVTLDLLTPTNQAAIALSFSSTSQVTTTTVTVAGGATTLPSSLTLYSNAVTAPTQVLVRAFYQGNFLIAPITVVPWLQNFAITPNGVIGGNSVTGTITLATTAPTGGITVQVQSSTNQLTTPATVTIAAGQSSAQCTITSIGVDNKSFPIATASLLGYGVAQSVELDPAGIISVVLTPIRVSGGTAVSGVITLNGLAGPAFPPVTVNVQGNPAGYSVSPSTVSFAGTSSVSGTFTINTPYEPATVTRVAVVERPAVPNTGYADQVSQSNFTVDTTALFTFTLDKTSANPGDTVNGTIALATTADTNGAVVAVASSSPVVTVTSPQIVPAGSTGITFPLTVGSTVVTNPTTVTITATRGTTMIAQTLQVNISTMQLVLSPTSVHGGANNSVTGTLTLSAPAGSSGLVISLAAVNNSSNGAPGITFPSTVTVPAGATTVTFTIGTSQVPATQELTLTATAGAMVATANLEIRASQLTSITFTPSSVRGTRTGFCRITLDGGAPAGGAVITLTSTNSRVASFPATVTILPGQTSTSFSFFVRRVSRPLSTTVTATYQGSSVSALFTAVRY